MKVRFFDPGKSYLKIKGEVNFAMERVLTYGQLILQEDVARFERSLAEYVGTKYAVGLNSGTDALYLALKACGIGRGSKVTVPSHTFVAAPQVVVQLGATPMLFDLGEDGGGIGNRADAHMVAHIAGELSSIPHTNLPVIEDACQAIGAVKNPTSDVQCWSFYPAKILGAFGDAGAITTNDEKIYNYIKEARNHFKTDYSDWGINSRLDNLQAAVLNVKIQYLDQAIDRRQEIAIMYSDGLRATTKSYIGLPNHSPGRVWQDYIIQTPFRDQMYDYLKTKGIETMKNEYPFPIQKLPLSLKYESETLRLPCNENLTDEEVNYVIRCLRDFTV